MLMSLAFIVGLSTLLSPLWNLSGLIGLWHVTGLSRHNSSSCVGVFPYMIAKFMKELLDVINILLHCHTMLNRTNMTLSSVAVF